MGRCPPSDSGAVDKRSRPRGVRVVKGEWGSLGHPPYGVGGQREGNPKLDPDGRDGGAGPPIPHHRR